MEQVLAGDYDKKSVQDKISGFTSEPCVVFAQVSCPYCKKAKELLSSVGAKYKVSLCPEEGMQQLPCESLTLLSPTVPAPQVVEVDALGVEGYAIRVELNELTGRSSVPNIFIGGKPVGGFSDGPGVENLEKEGKLVGLLKEAGAL